MISKQASTLPRRLLRRYGTSDPFELADCLGITILECHDFKLQKGAFKVILNNLFFEHLDPRFNGRLGRWFVERTAQ